MKWVKCFALLVVGSLLLSGCSESEPQANSQTSEAANSLYYAGKDETVTAADDGENVIPDFAMDPAEEFTDRDQRIEFDDQNCVSVQLNGTSATADSETVSIAGTTITISADGTYIFSGSLTSGMIIVDAPETAKPQIVFNGASVTSPTSAALYVKEADKVFLTLREGTENTLANGGTFTAIDENNIDGAIFSKQDLTLNGNGSLTILSPIGHGIVSKDDLVLVGGSYTVQAASHGLTANDCIRISGSALSVQAGKDGCHSENDEDAAKGYLYVESGDLDITAEGDGLSSGSYLQIDSGSVKISAGGGNENGNKQSSDRYGYFMGENPGGSYQVTTEDSASMKGMKAQSGLLINGGTVTIDAADDALHSNGSTIINDGSFTLASGDDGIHADEELTLTGGKMAVSVCYEGLEGMHIDISGGDVSLYAADDGINAAGGNDSSGFGGPRGGDQFGGGGQGSILISGGSIYVNADGDGIDSNGTLTISGGSIVVSGPDMGDTATLDYDISGVISGGLFIGTGASGMNQNFSADSEQGTIMLSVDSQKAGTEVVLLDEEGNTILSFTTDQDFSCVILSCPDIVVGSTYTVKVGSSETEISMTSTVYGSGGNMGGMNGGHGGMGGGPGGGKR